MGTLVSKSLGYFTNLFQSFINYFFVVSKSVNNHYRLSVTETAGGQLFTSCRSFSSRVALMKNFKLSWSKIACYPRQIDDILQAKFDLIKVRSYMNCFLNKHNTNLYWPLFGYKSLSWKLLMVMIFTICGFAWMLAIFGGIFNDYFDTLWKLLAKHTLGSSKWFLFSFIFRSYEQKWWCGPGFRSSSNPQGLEVCSWPFIG